jgi:hypothetical protein
VPTPTGLGSIQPTAGYIINTMPGIGDLTASAAMIVDRPIYKVDPQWGAFIQIVKRWRSVSMPELGKDYKIWFGKKKSLPRYAVVATDATAAATTIYITVGHGVYFGRQELWQNEATGEIFRNEDKYTAGTPDQLGVIARAQGTVAAQPMQAGNVLVRLSFVGAEAGRMPDQPIALTEWDYNYWFEGRASVQYSDWAAMMKMLANEDVARDAMAQALNKIQKDEVAHLLYGQRKSGTTDQTDATQISGRMGASAKVFSCDGFIETMRRNGPPECCQNVSGTLTGGDFRDVLGEKWLLRGSEQKLVGVGQKVLGLIDDMKWGKLTLYPDNEKMNLKLYEWIVKGKQVMLVYDSSLDAPDVGTSARGEMMIGCDLGSVGGEDFSPQIVRIKPNAYHGITPTEGETAALGQIIGMHSFLNPHPEAQLFVEGIFDVAA